MAKSFKKIFGGIILYGLILFVLTSCSSNKSTDNKSPSISDIDEKIKETVNVSNMDIGDSKKLEKLYDVDVEDLEDFILYTPSTNIEANEIAILKVKDSNKIDDIKDKLMKRAEKQGDIFKDYLPDEYFLIEKYVLKAKDNYILFIISEDVETIEDIFDEFFK